MREDVDQAARPSPAEALEDGNSGKFGRGDRLKLRTRGKILKAARDLFADGGYMSCTVGDIAERAGVSRASFYVHFATKQDLLREVVKRDLEGQSIPQMQLQLTGKDPDMAIRRWISRYVRSLAKNRDGLRLYNFAVSVDPAMAREAYEASRRTALALAKRIERFRVYTADGDIDAKRLASLRLLLFTVEQLGAAVAFEAWDHDLDSSIDLLTRRFLSFIYAE
ncbi:MAG: hypothetical protein JWQ97_1558 [Phenylobacterium sp.]|nr:hypothetical protein [Phenylobacterium sp.]